ncbi:MAG: alpha/beta hydrolase [Opitutaceae bacterium]|nr:alpha/beta hydrolase [Opitutaceae bacterium]
MPRTAKPQFTYQHILEPGTDPAAPPLLLLHGTGGDEHDLLRLGRAISPGSALLSPRGDVNEGGALRFFARLSLNVFDPQEIIQRTHALADFVTQATAYHGLDARRLIAVGFSNGANIAATLMLLRPEALAGAVLLRSMVVLDQPAAPGSLAGKRALLCHGSTDPLVPADHPARLEALLRAGGAETRLETIPASHALTPQDVDRARTWLGQA